MEISSKSENAGDLKSENLADRKDIVQTYLIVATLLISLKPNEISQNFNNTTPSLIRVQTGENLIIYIAFLIFIILIPIYYSIRISGSLNSSEKNNYISSVSKGLAILFSIIVYYCLCETIIISYSIIYEKYYYSVIIGIIILPLLILITMLNTTVLDPTYNPNIALSNIQILFKTLKPELSKTFWFIITMIFLFGFIIIGTFLKSTTLI